MESNFIKTTRKNVNLGNIINDIEGINILKDRLEKRYLKYTKFNNILKDQKQCGIIFVLNLELLSIKETKRAIDNIKKKN